MHTFTCCIIVLLISTISAYNILVYSPAFGSSHSKFMGRLADTLTDAGHNVTLLIPVVDVSRRNTTGVKTTKDVIFVDQDEIGLQKISSPQNTMLSFWFDNYKAEDYRDSYSFFHNNMIETCANLFRNKQVFNEMKTRNFDVILNEPLSICGLGFAYKLGVRKMIQTSSCTMYEFMNSYIGEPDEYAYVPSVIGQTSDQMDLLERFENFKTTHYIRQYVEEVFNAEESCYKTQQNEHKDIPSWKELLATFSMYFTNANANLDFPRPTIQKTVMIGGISVDMDYIKSQRLNEEWENVLKLRKKTMLISFGSMIQSKDMPITYRKTLLRVIQSFPDVTFIWKYESYDTQWADHVPNVHFSKWVPQTALLNDKRVTAFLTHGGLGSVNELAYTAKPALMVPIFWDQARNGKMYERLGAAITIRKTDLDNYELVRSSIQSILFDESYTKKAQRIADILENLPLKPKDLVVKYTEFVARFGPFPNMDPYVRHLNFIERAGLDVLAIWHSGSIVFVLLSIVVCIYLFSHVRLSIRRKNT